ncbi:MAG: sugar transporter [Sphingopyxis sp.]
MAARVAAPKTYWIIASLLLLWNLMGVGAYFMQVRMDLSALAVHDPYTARLFAEMPNWAWAAYAVAVGMGAFGAIALLLRHRIAMGCFALSIIGIIVQFGRTFLLTDLIAVRGWGTALFPAIILLMAIVGLWFARSGIRRGWLR